MRQHYDKSQGLVDFAVLALIWQAAVPVIEKMQLY
jgi:hypothetical protein